MTTCHSTVEKCPVWLCGVLAQIVVLRQTESSCNFSSLSSTFSFLCIIFFLILSPLLLCPSFLVWLWAVYLLFEIRVDICECYTETILWKYTALCLCSLFHDRVCMFIANVCSFRFRLEIYFISDYFKNSSSLNKPYEMRNLSCTLHQIVWGQLHSEV